MRANFIHDAAIKVTSTSVRVRTLVWFHPPTFQNYVKRYVQTVCSIETFRIPSIIRTVGNRAIMPFCRERRGPHRRDLKWLESSTVLSFPNQLWHLHGKTYLYVNHIIFKVMWIIAGLHQNWDWEAIHSWIWQVTQPPAATPSNKQMTAQADSQEWSKLVVEPQYLVTCLMTLLLLSTC